MYFFITNLSAEGMLQHVFSFKTLANGNRKYLLKSLTHLGNKSISTCNLHRTNSKLSKVRTDILLVTEQNRAMQSALSPWPVTECPSVTKRNTCVKCNPSFIPSRNPEPSISSPQPSESMRRSLLKVSSILSFGIPTLLSDSNVNSLHLVRY